MYELGRLRRTCRQRRIRGDGYDYKTDCWSLALTLLEFAFGKFPYAVAVSNEKKQQQNNGNEDGLQRQTSGGITAVFWDIMDLIVNGPSPESELCKECHGTFTETFRAFVKRGLQKDADARCTRAKWCEPGRPSFEIQKWTANVSDVSENRI